MNNLSELTNEELKEYYDLYEEMISESGRAEGVKIHSFDLKFAYHVVRLLSEIEQIMEYGELDLQEKGRREHMKAIRRGEVSEDEIRKWASEKESQLERLYEKTELPKKPDLEKIKQILLNCLEEHYGSLKNLITEVGWAERKLEEIDTLLNEIRPKLLYQ